MNLITKEEYQQILDRLDYIQTERNNLKKINQNPHYCAHIQLPETFPELILKLERDNKLLNHDLKTEKNKFLTPFLYSKNIYTILENKIDYLITVLKNNCNFCIMEDPELVSIKNNYPTFESFYQNIRDIISKKEANTFLLNYIKDLDREEQLLITQKQKYEKRNKKKKRFRHKQSK